MTLAEAKSYVGVPAFDTSQDALITGLIKAAREALEKDTNRAFITQSFFHKQDCFPVRADFIELKRPPIIAVTSFTYVNTTGSVVAVTTDTYEVDTNREPGVVYLRFGKTWPSTRDIQNAVSIKFTAGYGTPTTAASVPQLAKDAMLMWLDDRFCARGVDAASNQKNYWDAVHRLRWGDYR